MNRRRWSAIALCSAFFLCFAAGARAQQSADDLFSQGKAYKARGKYDLAVKAECDAAKLDPKYQIDCDRDSTYVNGRLRDFQDDIDRGTAKRRDNDCQGAKDEFDKVRFGPLLDQAQQLSAEAKKCMEGPKVDPDLDILKKAQLAFANNDFPTAAQNAEQVKSPQLLTQAQTIINNVKNYTDAMQQAKEFERRNNFGAARQQYEIAAGIKRDGPGNPASKVQEMIAKANPQAPGPDPKAAQIRAALAEAQAAVARGDCTAAIVAYSRALELNPQQADAAAGKATCQAQMVRTDPGLLEKILADGVRAYYESNFSGAQGDISNYIEIRGQNMGAAYFYLGATMLSQAVLASPKSKEEYSRLQQGALDNFRLAKQEKFKPVEKYVSPRILAVWNQAGM